MGEFLQLIPQPVQSKGRVVRRKPRGPGRAALPALQSAGPKVRAQLPCMNSGGEIRRGSGPCGEIRRKLGSGGEIRGFSVQGMEEGGLVQVPVQGILGEELRGGAQSLTVSLEAGKGRSEAGKGVTLCEAKDGVAGRTGAKRGCYLDVKEGGKGKGVGKLEPDVGGVSSAGVEGTSGGVSGAGGSPARALKASLALLKQSSCCLGQGEADGLQPGRPGGSPVGSPVKAMGGLRESVGGEVEALNDPVAARGVKKRMGNAGSSPKVSGGMGSGRARDDGGKGKAVRVGKRGEGGGGGRAQSPTGVVAADSPVRRERSRSPVRGRAVGRQVATSPPVPGGKQRKQPLSRHGSLVSRIQKAVLFVADDDASEAPPPLAVEGGRGQVSSGDQCNK